MAATADDIRREIATLKTRIAATTDELDGRLARLPRAAAWAYRHKRVLLAIQTVLIGALWVVGARQRGTQLDGPGQGPWVVTLEPQSTRSRRRRS